MILGISSTAWTIVGVVLNVTGVILLFRYGMPFRVRRNGQQYLVLGQLDAKDQKVERLYDVLGWVGLATVVVGAALQIIGAIKIHARFVNAAISFSPGTLWASLLSKAPEFWSTLFTGGLFLVSVVALSVACGQLRTVKTERTIRLIKEISSEKMERVLGFFDFAADKNVSRRAFSDLFAKLIKARADALRNKHVSDVNEASTIADALILAEINEAIAGSARTPSGELQERELRRRIVEATNFFERVWALVNHRTVNAGMFLASQDYNVVAPYYVLEEVLNDLVKHEDFDFDEFRQLVKRAQPFLNKWLPDGDPLRVAKFEELPLPGPSLRETNR